MILTEHVLIISSVSDLGFPARAAVCSSQQFSVGHCVFSGVTIFVYSNVLGVMLSTNAMFKSELNKQLLSRGKIKISLFTDD